MSTIRKFIQEASLRGNKSTPDSYLDGVGQRADQDIRGTEQRLGPDMRAFMQFVQQVHSIQRKAGPAGLARLEKLAEQTILNAYGNILGDTVLNIKFPQQNEVKNMMEETPDDSSEMPKLKELEDKGVISEVQKRKIANNITQGEAKNAKRMLVMPEVRDGLVQILGNEDGQQYLDLLRKITDIASALDWRIPIDIQKRMWTQDKNGFAGSVKVDWEKPNTDEDLATKILKDLEEGDAETSPAAEEAFGEMKPTINALGTDFAMLLHEAIKGIYELIASAGIPEDEEVAKTVLMNTDTLEDELEDLRYGPYLAGDLRDYINQFPEAADVENIREFVFGKLMQLPAEEFLAVMKAIFTRDPSAKNTIQAMIIEVKQELKDWELGQAFGNEDEPEEDYSEPADDYGQSAPEPEDDGEEDLSNLSKRELEAKIDAALDSGNFAEVARLSKFMEE